MRKCASCFALFPSYGAEPSLIEHRRRTSPEGISGSTEHLQARIAMQGDNVEEK